MGALRFYKPEGLEVASVNRLKNNAQQSQLEIYSVFKPFGLAILVSVLYHGLRPR